MALTVEELKPLFLYICRGSKVIGQLTDKQFYGQVRPGPLFKTDLKNRELNLYVLAFYWNSPFDCQSGVNLSE